MFGWDLEHQRILDLISKAVRNTTTMHALDEKRVTRIFYNEIMSNGWYGMDEVEKITNSLYNFSEYNRERIVTIAQVIQRLRDR